MVLLLLVSCSLSYSQRAEKDENKKESLLEAFNKRDKNEDGKLDKSELIGVVSNNFEKVDADGDGFLSIEEFEAARKLKENKKGDRRRPNPEEAFKMLDTNQDEKISKEEAKGPLAEHFDRIDSNDDGFITVDELEKMQRRRGSRRGGPRRNN